MKAFRCVLWSAGILLSTLPLFSCGNALEGGSEPSGSVIRVLSVDEGAPGDFNPDLILSVCSTTTDADGFITYEYEEGLTNHYATVTMRNDSRPNTPTDQPTNSIVRMGRYRVDFTGINMTVSIPSIDGAGQTVVIDPGGTATMNVLIMGLDTLEYIRAHYPQIGHVKDLQLRATITIWGEDDFQVQVSAQGEATLVVTNYDRC